VLRRTQATKAQADDIGAMRAEIERAFTPNPELRDPTALPPEIERPFAPRPERGPDSRPRMRASIGARPSRIALVMVAIIAGGIAAYLALQRNQPAPEPVIQVVTEPVPVVQTKVLVAKRGIGVGQRLSPASVEWVEWPESSLRPEYITHEAVPDAITHMSGAVARYEFLPGEPIREQKLAQAGNGYLSVVLDSGVRAVSVVVMPESASGGFILPDDRVDVVLTRASERGQESSTILKNVRVLAINNQLSGTKPKSGEAEQVTAFSGQAIATLALDPTQAEIIIGAGMTGRLSLVLRSMSDMADEDAPLSAVNQAIRLSSPFWTR
jgi:pilus assembly protein CpaB